MRKTNEQNIKDVLKELVETYRLKSKLTTTKIQTLWEQLMGKTVTEHTTELKIRNQKLYVYVDSAPLRQELSYSREKILTDLNTKLEEEFLKEVIIK
jgi:hypothetical protein